MQRERCPVGLDEGCATPMTCDSTGWCQRHDVPYGIQPKEKKVSQEQQHVQRKIVETVIPVAKWGSRHPGSHCEAVLFRMSDGYFLSIRRADRETGQLYEFANAWRERGEFHVQNEADTVAASYFDEVVRKECDVVMGRVPL